MNSKKIKDMIISNEGCKLKPYKCTAGKLTIGYGRNLTDKGISLEEADHFLDTDILECIRDLTCIFPDQFNKMPEDIQMVLIDMRYQLGHDGFTGFRKMIKAVRNGKFNNMIFEMENSKWYHQTKNRTEKLMSIVKTFLR